MSKKEEEKEEFLTYKSVGEEWNSGKKVSIYIRADEDFSIYDTYIKVFVTTDDWKHKIATVDDPSRGKFI
jgi:hypothetical protein